MEGQRAGSARRSQIASNRRIAWPATESQNADMWSNADIKGSRLGRVGRIAQNRLRDLGISVHIVLLGDSAIRHASCDL